MTGTRQTDLGAPPPPSSEGERPFQEWLRVKREEQPVWQDQHGVWHLFRHEHVKRLCSDYATFSSTPTGMDSEMAMGNLTMLDPPEHRNLRRLVSVAFTPRTVARLEPRIREVTRELLDGASGEFDLAEVLAHPMPVIVIAELLGVPSSDRSHFAECADRILAVSIEDPNDPALAEQFEAVMSPLTDYLLEYVQARRRKPADDLVSALVAAEVDGARLSDAEIVMLGAIVLSAGHITSTLLIGNTILSLDENPEALRLVREDRSVVPAVVEEALRFRTPFAQVARITKQDVTIEGVTIPAGSSAVGWIVSANRDERAFSDAAKFDVRRDTSEHIAFSHGPHYCLGAALARLEAQISLGELLDRYSEIRLNPAVTPEFYPWQTAFGMRNVPVTTKLA
ncbi:hypothetical protein BBK82_30945 [Lentzea guizhouensis]|uniref:Cytochrome n=1 Tax=Lentzea guizhouensis TaxID=1586287 RepID=A0A1B2HPZ9_9PSEU|nr:cytochrome P450 [Lentzea guizhouensis]ANZ39804.1 hypothetical protein BBK82_30945 [Lentzea guizhouensis]